MSLTWLLFFFNVCQNWPCCPSVSGHMNNHFWVISFFHNQNNQRCIKFCDNYDFSLVTVTDHTVIFSWYVRKHRYVLCALKIDQSQLLHQFLKCYTQFQWISKIWYWIQYLPAHCNLHICVVHCLHLIILVLKQVSHSSNPQRWQSGQSSSKMDPTVPAVELAYHVRTEN